jgi:hypothetical protein
MAIDIDQYLPHIRCLYLRGFDLPELVTDTACSTKVFRDTAGMRHDPARAPELRRELFRP